MNAFSSFSRIENSKSKNALTLEDLDSFRPENTFNPNFNKIDSSGSILKSSVRFDLPDNIASTDDTDFVIT